MYFLLACTAGDADTGVASLPPLDTSGWQEDSGTFPIDTGDSGAGDEAPAHWLTLRQEGTWVPGGDPDDPSSVTGDLFVTEVLDGDEEAPVCAEQWALVGTRVEEACDGCEAFRVVFTQVTTEGACRTPELPTDGEERTLGYSAIDEQIYWDWHDTGVWVALWSAVETIDGVVTAWEDTLGVTVEDEE